MIKRKKHSHQLGFSLIELMVVVAILGVMLVTVSIGINRALSDPVAKDEAKRLRALLQLASEEAVLFNRSLGVRFENEKYTFYTLEEVAVEDDDQQQLQQNPFLPGASPAQSDEQQTELKWLELEEDEMFLPRELPEEHRFVVTLDGLEINLDENTFKSRDEEDDIKPHVFITPDGDIGPDFEIKITIDGFDDVWGDVLFDDEGELVSRFHDGDDA